MEVFGIAEVRFQEITTARLYSETRLRSDELVLLPVYIGGMLPRLG